MFKPMIERRLPFMRGMAADQANIARKKQRIIEVGFSLLAEKGIESGIKERSGFVEAVGWIRKGHAELLINPAHILFAAIHSLLSP